MVKPIGNRILVRQTDSADKIGEILMPDTARTNKMLGEVIADQVDSPVAKGNIIYFGSAIAIDVNGEQLLVVKYKDILAIVE